MGFALAHGCFYNIRPFASIAKVSLSSFFQNNPSMRDTTTDTTTIDYYK